MVVQAKINEIAWLAPSGMQISLRISFGAPVCSFNLYSPEWINKYTELGLMMYDPNMKWAYENIGTCRWSTLKDGDTHSILKMAEGYGIKYGATVSCRTQNQVGNRSIATFGRNDREYEDAELTHLHNFLQNLHDEVTPPTNITNAEIEALKMLKQGMIIKEVAAELGVSDNAVKQRLSNARRKLKANTTVHATALAQQYGLI
ncbi:LuxR family transcriptional regulator [Amylibacter sp. SFDW26]|uniref:helix-turn-helix transcriptional regulator n=1 Tax=Amylibacter sp. SFDW26 TaxID=2652722 RepID=UPI0012616A3D|nr:autoinducer binding domain-containing protein [Amylibacter sp. SFDW26]KAB7613695.1 LuxR family transcriptional regulator [Amylibacter sp. SFDW26]